METVKLTQEELQSLKKVTQEESLFISKLGQLEYQISLLKKEKESITKDLLSTNDQKTALAQSLEKKYGEGSIDIETGEFTKTN